jgi:hypothetical protein
MKKPPLGGSGQEAKSDLTLMAPDEQRRTLRGWLSASEEIWHQLVVAGAWHPHRVSKAARKLWPDRLRTWCPKRRAYLYTWPELHEIAAYLAQEKWR